MGATTRGQARENVLPTTHECLPSQTQGVRVRVTYIFILGSFLSVQG